MKPIEFEEQTVTVGKGQKEYEPLPAYLSRDTDGRMVFCWKLTWRERIACLLNGMIWQQVLTFHRPLQPQLITVEKPHMGSSSVVPLTE